MRDKVRNRCIAEKEEEREKEVGSLTLKGAERRRGRQH